MVSVGYWKCYLCRAYRALNVVNVCVVVGSKLMKKDFLDTRLKQKVEQHTYACKRIKSALRVVDYWKTIAKETLTEIEMIEKETR
ncbi:hypothetical protein [Microaceticoccus formicicus]|uniref:hypothetical protein n=1 Tax=Microaceticoccus formicicus TaxID=3118105 RepID=UPI003CD04C4F|nr:hypothetical protein VZL98_04845 [Peptoniphilaceae bacterium AMB_02]